VSQRKKIFGVLQYVLLSAIGILLLWLTFRNQDLIEIFHKIRQANGFYITLSVFIGLAAFMIRAYRWNMLIEPLGYSPRLSGASYALGIGYFANLAIPRIGEITRCGVLSKSENIPVEKLLGTVITERIIDLVMLAFSMLLVAAVEFDLFSDFISKKIISPLNESSGQGSKNHVMLIIIILSVIIAGMIWVFFSKRAINIRKKVMALMTGLSSGLLSVLKMKKKGLFIFHTFLMWFLYFLATFVCFFAFDATAHLGFKEGLFILVAGGLGMSAPVQGGIGAYHYIVSQALLLFGVSLTDGIVYATLVHTAQIFLIVVLGLISLMMIVNIRKKKNIV